ncbi:hypothetical protein [Methanocella conradii]|uniref:hypothetical protein n=1 Tax=Methanocella conradii TaxID=1175444 RepID=UPI0024B379CD|nr:hypothetical protein [Methanocella conradii]MDI6896360.1 hypothetical protein [Methanocella conradii]
MPVLDLMNILLMAIIFIISLAVILAITRVRALENSTVKTIAYIGLGLIMFTLVGFTFNMWENPPSDGLIIAKDIVMPYTQFYPNLILAMAIAATVLITYMERDNYAYFFAGMGFAVLVPDLYKYIFINGRSDLALLGCALWAVVPMIWAFIWRESALIEMKAWEKFMRSLKATLISYPVYLFTAIIAIFGESNRGISLDALQGVASSVPEIIMFILVTIWLFYLLNIIIASVMFAVHDLFVHLLGYRRVVRAGSVRYERAMQASAKTPQPKPKVNHYAGLIEEMQVFSKYMGQIDRIRAASTIGRFKSEYQTLAAKYNEDSKADAEKMIRMIEQEFMKKY